MDRDSIANFLYEFHLISQKYLKVFKRDSAGIMEKETTSEKKKTKLSNFLPEIISLLANVADIFMESALRLFIIQAACEHLNPFSTACRGSQNDAKAEDGVQDLAAFYLMFNRIILEVPVLFILPFCGSWSDTAGRKLPLMISGVGCTIAAFIFMLSTMHPGKYLWLVLVGTCVRGLVCRTAVVTMAVSTMVADTTTKDERTRRLSFLLATRYFGSIIGLIFQGMFLEHNKFTLVFLLDMIVFVLIVIVALVFVVDTNKKDEENGKGEKKRRKFHFWESVKILGHKPEKGTLLQLWLIFIILMLDHAGKAGEKEIMILFVNIRIPSFTNADFSWFWTIETIALALLATFGIYFISKVLKFRDTSISIFAVSTRIIRLVLLACSYNVPMLYVANLIGTPITLLVSTTRSLMSKVVSDQDYGKAFSLASCFDTIANMIGSIVILGFYRKTASIFTGFGYLLIAFFYVIIFAILIYMHFVIKEDMPEEEKPGGYVPLKKAAEDDKYYDTVNGENADKEEPSKDESSP